MEPECRARRSWNGAGSFRFQAGSPRLQGATVVVRCDKSLPNLPLTTGSFKPRSFREGGLARLYAGIKYGGVGNMGKAFSLVKRKPVLSGADNFRFARSSAPSMADRQAAREAGCLDGRACEARDNFRRQRMAAARIVTRMGRDSLARLGRGRNPR